MHLRRLAISLAKSSKTFHRLPNGTFGLTAWYDAAAIGGKKRAEKEETEAESETQPETDDKQGGTAKAVAS